MFEFFGLEKMIGAHQRSFEQSFDLRPLQKLRGDEPLREIKPQANQFAHKYSLDAAPPIMELPGGELRIVSQKEFPITTMTGATMLINPGGVRELHWHPNADEWQFILSGRARVTIFGAHGRTKTSEIGQGQIAFVKQGFGHYSEQIGSEPLRILLLFS